MPSILGNHSNHSQESVAARPRPILGNHPTSPPPHESIAAGMPRIPGGILSGIWNLPGCLATSTISTGVSMEPATRSMAINSAATRHTTPLMAISTWASDTRHHLLSLFIPFPFLGFFLLFCFLFLLLHFFFVYHFIVFISLSLMIFVVIIIIFFCFAVEMKN